MSVPKNIRIRNVLLMTKFESPILVTRKLQVEFGEQTPGVDCIRKTFQRFCKTRTVEDRQRSGRPPVIYEGKLKKR